MPDTIEIPQFSESLEALADINTPFPARLLRGFSDLTPRYLKEMSLVWQTLPFQRKIDFLEDLESVLDTDTLVNFDELARFVLQDADPAVRILALRLLWECETPSIITELVRILAQDEDEATRATTASLLGKFVLLGEYDALNTSNKNLVISALLAVLTGNEKPLVRQRSLESLGYSSHPSVPDLIQQALQSPDNLWVAAALCAIGRSADDAWAPQVEQMLNSADAEVQFEAIRAAGELELTSARESLLNLLDNEIEDEEIKLSIIWSLSQIGGDDIKEKLTELLEDASSENESEWIEKAIENLELSVSGSMNLFDYSPDDYDEDLDEDDFGEDVDDLEDDDEEYLDEEIGDMDDDE